MAKCLLCGNEWTQAPNLWELLAWKPIELPLICPTCEKEMAWLTGPVCSGCGRSLTTEAKELCPDCLQWQQNKGWTPKNTAFLSYHGLYQQWLLQLKGTGDIRLAAYFKVPLQQLSRQYRQVIWVPIPSSPKSYRERGFHQTEVILKAAKIPYQSLLRMGETQEKQALKTKRERMQRPNPFVIACDNKPTTTPQVVLFDDVYTTGTTLYHAQRTLEAAGYEVVASVTLAR